MPQSAVYENMFPVCFVSSLFKIWCVQTGLHTSLEGRIQCVGKYLFAIEEMVSVLAVVAPSASLKYYISIKTDRMLTLCRALIYH